MKKQEILDWLKCEDEYRLEELWKIADEIRRRKVGDEVHLRGLIEFSNICARECSYCGLHAGNTDLQRYRMGEDEIMACVLEAAGYG